MRKFEDPIDPLENAKTKKERELILKKRLQEQEDLKKIC